MTLYGLAIPNLQAKRKKNIYIYIIGINTSFK